MTRTLSFWIGIICANAGFWAYILLSTRSQLAGPFVYRVRTGRRCVALTFDDGPNQPYSLLIADIVESYRGKATFFQVGECVERDPKTTKQLHKRGHVIGSHSWSHSLLKPLSNPFYTDELDKTHKLIQSITGKPVKYFRPPWLFRTHLMMHSLKKRQLTAVSGKFMNIAEFRQPSGEKMAQKALRHIKPGDIIICHDGYNNIGADRTQTVKAVKILCEQLHKDGYEFVGLDELLP